MPDSASTPEEQMKDFVVQTTEQPEAKETQPDAHKDKTPPAGQGAESAKESAAADNPDETGAKKPAGTAGEPDAGADGSGADSGAEDEVSDTTNKPKNKISGAERLKQINEATRLMRETERNIAAREAAVAEREASLKKGGLTDKASDTTNTNSDAAPDPNDTEKYPYGSLDERYINDLTDYRVDQKLKAKDAENEKARQADAAAAKQRELQQKGQELLKTGAAKYDDFEQVIIEGGKGLPPLAIGELLLNSPEGADVAYHLATHPSEARALAAKSPFEQAAWFGRTAVKFSSSASDAPGKQPAKTTQAPPPPKNSVKGAGATTTFDPATSDFQAFERGVSQR